jgi:hypothetical protein
VEQPPPAFDDWHHITISAYGQWLPGDPRSWRTRHHRQHVLGSYDKPPLPSHRSRRLHEYAAASLRNEPMVFLPHQRPLLSEIILEALAYQRITPLIFSVGGEHCHLLLQFSAPSPKIAASRIKSWVWNQANRRGFLTADQTGRELWGEGSHDAPIADRGHLVRTIQYIADHAAEGAWVWRSAGDGVG